MKQQLNQLNELLNNLKEKLNKKISSNEKHNTINLGGFWTILGSHYSSKTNCSPLEEILAQVETCLENIAILSQSDTVDKDLITSADELTTDKLISNIGKLYGLIEKNKSQFNVEITLIMLEAYLKIITTEVSTKKKKEENGRATISIDGIEFTGISSNPPSPK